MPPCNGKCVVCTAFNYSCRYVLYFCFCNKGSLCSFPHFDNFLNGDSFLCSLATKFNMHAEMDNLSPQKAPGVSPQTNVIKEELISIKLKKNSLFSLTTTFRLNVHAKSLVTLGHMEHRLLGRCSQASMASQGNKVPVLQLSRFKVELESN